MQWEKITDIVLITSFAVLAVFACLGLYQWATRKSFHKIDRHLKAFIPPLIFMVIIYIVFDKFIILSVRPDGSGEPSFPSTHTMVVATIFFMTMLALPHYIKKKSLCITLDIVMVILISLTATGRIVSNKHWPADVVCGLVFALVLSGFYCFLIKKSPHDIKSLKSTTTPPKQA